MTPGEFGYSLLYWWLLASGVCFNMLIVVLFLIQVKEQFKRDREIRRMKARERKARKRFLAKVGRDADWIDAEIIPPDKTDLPGQTAPRP